MSSSETSSTPTEQPRSQGPSQRQLLLIGVIALALIVLGILVYPRSSTSSSGGRATVGQSVPTFSIPALSGVGHVGVPADGGGNGKAAVLIFFASWCGPCKTEMPALSAAINEGKADPAAVIGINSANPNTSAAKSFVASNNMRFPVGVDPEGTLTSGSFGFPGLPYTVFVNSKGIVTEIHEGVTTPAELQAGVAKLG
jgi:thiol-disulfide isomerase/thioredoxin